MYVEGLIVIDAKQQIGKKSTRKLFTRFWMGNLAAAMTRPVRSWLFFMWLMETFGCHDDDEVLGASSFSLNVSRV